MKSLTMLKCNKRQSNRQKHASLQNPANCHQKSHYKELALEPPHLKQWMDVVKE